ncbi:MAG: hypothetical protein NPIRA05_21880 [Nitrospirales bacterium]|nr:MAG: hypothetical protein NPIRA05_21880 [Nitrospirales bacterium]
MGREMWNEHGISANSFIPISLAGHILGHGINNDLLSLIHSLNRVPLGF